MATASTPSPKPLSSPFQASGFYEVSKNAIDTLFTEVAATLDHAAQIRNIADDSFLDIIEDYKLDITTIKDDGIEELQRVLCDIVEEARESAAVIVWEVWERVEEVYADVCERLDGSNELVGGGRGGLKREKALRREKKALRREKKALRREKKALRREEKALRREKKALRREEKALRREKKASRRERKASRRELSCSTSLHF
jgi:hypothetical protein